MSGKIVAVSSVGGHWVELLRLRAAFSESEVIYITTSDEYRVTVGNAEFHSIRDFNRKNPWLLIGVMRRLYTILRRVRPDFVVSTGAAPGLLAICIARSLGINTIWVESIANAEELSMSGKIASCIAHRSYVQWPELAGRKTRYAGNVLR